jgi:hypothetical protein
VFEVFSGISLDIFIIIFGGTRFELRALYLQSDLPLEPHLQSSLGL